MSVLVDSTVVALTSPATAPLVEGSAPTTFRMDGPAVGFEHSGGTGRYGCRIALSSATDFTTHDFIAFQIGKAEPFGLGGVSSVATGGQRVIFVDNAGSYAGFNVYGTGVPNYRDGPEAGFQGFPTSYLGVGQDGLTGWCISRAKTPDISGGSINWANITHVELSLNRTSSGDYSSWIGNLRKHNGILVTGTETLASIASGGNTSADRQFFIEATYALQSNPSASYTSKIGFRVGNGSTATNLTDSRFSVGFLTTYDKSPTFRSVGPLVQLNPSNTRLLLINQSASDVLNLTDGAFASGGWWQWTLQGSGSASCTRVAFWRFNGFTAGHGTYTDCSWNSGEAAVLVTAATNIVRGTVRDGFGIRITSGAANYNNLQVAFSDNGTNDIELGSGGAGVYTLGNISVIGSYTLKIRNNHPTNAITVEVPAGITTSTTTAGGSITIESPQLTTTIAAQVSLVGAEVRIYDLDNSPAGSLGTQLAGVESCPGSTFSFTAAAGNSVWVQIMLAGYKEFGQQLVGPSASTTYTMTLLRETNG